MSKGDEYHIAQRQIGERKNLRQGGKRNGKDLL